MVHTSQTDPFQNKIFRIIQESNAEFYLTGGTALSRFYLQHRYSDDLDLFLNAHPDFRSQCHYVLKSLGLSNLSFEVATTSDSFLRLFVHEKKIHLKMDFVNDVPFRYGDFSVSGNFHKIDHWRNILSNKLYAISRLEPKDITDILFIANKYTFSWEDIIKEARQKDLWVDPLNICQIVNGFPEKSFDQIKWIRTWNANLLHQDLRKMHDDIFYGRLNSLSVSPVLEKT